MMFSYMKRTSKLIKGWYSFAIVFFISISLIYIGYVVKHSVLDSFDSASSQTISRQDILESRHTDSAVVAQFTPVSSHSQPTQSTSTNLGHFAYGEDDSSRLMTIASYAQGEYQRFEKLDQEASLAFMQMVYAARDESVWIVPVSGFRNISDQKLLFDRQIQKLGSVEAAAKLSAPPGNSEHHTGYAIDLADGTSPKQDITYQFENSAAFKWLQGNAGKFGFELSFTKGNKQGVSYEPWHWRYVGSDNAKSIFAEAKSQR